MKISYDKIADIMYIYFRKGKIKGTVKVSDQFLVDVDSRKNVLGVEILDASSQISKKQILSTIKTGVPVLA